MFGAVRPDGEHSFALMLPVANTATMQVFLDEFAATLAPDVHAVMVLDQAGWHGSRALAVPDNVTLVPLPPYSPQLNPIERVWLYLRERFPSLRLFHNADEVDDACCEAWNAVASNPDRIRSLCWQPWIRKITE